MKKTISFTIYFVAGILIVYFASQFSIGSDEHWKEQKNNHLFELIIVRTLFGTIIGAIWSIITYYLYKAFASVEVNNIKFWRYFLLTISGYLFVALISTLIFIQQVS